MAASKTVRISEETHAKLAFLAKEDNTTLTSKLEEAIREKERKQLLEKANREYAALREDEEAWRDYQAETREIEGTSSDGLHKY